MPAKSVSVFDEALEVLGFDMLLKCVFVSSSLIFQIRLELTNAHGFLGRVLRYISVRISEYSKRDFGRSALKSLSTLR